MPEPAPQNDKPRADSPKVVISTPAGDAVVNVEVAANGAKIQRGLMYREAMALDAGMIFLMPEERVQEFWMHNTLIALDMIFIKKDMTVAGVVENATPRTDDIRKVDVPSQYVLEVNAGWAKAHQVAAGAKVRFENVR